MKPGQFAWLFVVLVACVPASARAQECAEGRVATESTSGRCCWPGQVWDAANARCSGPPSCAEGRVAEGDACVLATTPLEVGRSEPRSAGRRADPDLTLAGAVTLSLSYAFTISMGSVDAALAGDGSGWFTWVPVIGGVLWPVLGNTSAMPWILGIIGTAGQAAGVVLLALGLVGHTDGSEPLTFVPGAQGADVGASIAIRF